MSGFAALSRISRSVALSMLGCSCLAHSYWQRCHKTALWGAISGEEETAVELSRRRPYACPVDSFPQALGAHPSLRCIIYSFCPGLQDIRLLWAVSIAFRRRKYWMIVYAEAAGRVGERRAESASATVIIQGFWFISFKPHVKHRILPLLTLECHNDWTISLGSL